jgi:hypothetical protein
LGISQFFILEEFQKLFDEYFLDILGMFVLAEKVEEEVDVESALSFIGKGFQHIYNKTMGKFLIDASYFPEEPDKLERNGITSLLAILVE